MSPLSGLRNLRCLDLSNTSIRDITQFATLTALEYLDLTNTKVTELRPLGGLTRLRRIDLRGVSADTAALAHLPHCKVVTVATPPRRRER